ncbi:MAG: KH domain-containing protein [Candidatus Pacebacteria bacterium]|nr:KH domain-containing protein [Candidatus Paceibacterota bacterium]
MSEENKDIAFLEYVVKELVDNPEAVKVDRKVDEMGVLITLDVAPEDMGKIIGKSGNTAKAIRTLLRVVGMKNNSRVNLKINEPEGSTRPAPSARFEETANPVVDEKGDDDAKVDDASSVDDAIEDLKSM